MVLLQLSPTFKSRLALIALAVLTVWPLLHFTLVQRYDLNPWKFFGFAMYCVPTLPVRTTIEVIENGRSVAVEPRQLPVGARGAMQQFMATRGVLGKLQDPQPVAAWVFRTRPDAEEVHIEVRHSRIDPATGRIVEDRYPYEYHRDDLRRS